LTPLQEMNAWSSMKSQLLSADSSNSYGRSKLVLEHIAPQSVKNGSTDMRGIEILTQIVL
jgi:hypothetical protein